MAHTSDAAQKPLRVCVSGVTGAVGRLLANAILDQADMVIASAVGRSAAGARVGDLLSRECDLAIRPNLADAIERDTIDVLVDYTSASSAFDNVRLALASSIPVVVGSSGITAEQFQELDILAREREVGAIHGNFAITATLAQIFAANAAHHLKSWEIVEFAHANKIDAVSGTARELASRLADIGSPEQPIAPGDFVGDCRSRGATVQGTQVHALRLPGMVAGFEIIFGHGHERLTIRHEALSRAEPYIDGSLLAIRHVSNLVGVFSGLESILVVNPIGMLRAEEE